MESRMSPLDGLPVEVLYLIASACDHARDVAAWAATNHRYNAIVGHLLYHTEFVKQDYGIVFWAAQNGRVGTLRRWLSICQNTDEDSSVGAASLDVYTAPTWKSQTAYQRGPVNSVDLANRRHFCTPLHRAAEKGHSETVAFLLDHGGADINAQSYGVIPGGLNIFHDVRDRTGLFGLDCVSMSALHVAIVCHRAETAELLVRRNADLRVLMLRSDRESGISALHLAAANGMLDLLRMIGQVPGVNLDEPDMDGQTPLLYAAQNKIGYPSFAVLKELGADLDCIVRDRDGREQSLLVALIRRIRWKAAGMLIDLGANIDMGGGRLALLDECEIAKISVIHPEVPDVEGWDELVARLKRSEPVQETKTRNRSRKLWFTRRIAQ